MSVYLGVDFHARTQTVCWCDTADGLIHQCRPDHQRDDVRGVPRHLERQRRSRGPATQQLQQSSRIVRLQQQAPVLFKEKALGNRVVKPGQERVARG